MSQRYVWMEANTKVSLWMGCSEKRLGYDKDTGRWLTLRDMESYPKRVVDRFGAMDGHKRVVKALVAFG